MRRWVAAWALLAGCNKDTPLSVEPSTGSETHWLGDCAAEGSRCPEGSACLCGICTRPCAADDACGEGACAAAGEPAFDDLCGPAPGAVCVPVCGGDGDCPGDMRCDGGECRATEEGRALGALRREVFLRPAAPKLDVLFVVDDSGSMCEEQGVLADALERAAVDLPLADVDYRIAVVSTDFRSEGAAGRFLRRPAPPEPALNCVDPDSGMPRAPDTADCQALIEAGALPTILGADDVRADAVTLAKQLRCLTTLGTSGDGFEAGLEAVRTALSCDGPNAEAFGRCCVDGRYDTLCSYDRGDADAPEFLRPDARLAVVIVSDEDDCSAPSLNANASLRAICRYGPGDADRDGVPDGYRDARLCPGGDARACLMTECEGMAPERCFSERCTISRADNSNCVWHRDALTPVADYEAFLANLKRSPADDVFVLAYVGPRDVTASGEDVEYVPGVAEPRCDPESPEFDPGLSSSVCCPGGTCVGPHRPVCESPTGVAFSGRRYAELAATFGDHGCGPRRPGEGPSPCRICDEDAGAQFDAGFRSFFGSAVPVTDPLVACLAAPPACLVADASGAVGACAPAEAEDPDRYAVRAYSSCARETPPGGRCRALAGGRRLDPDEWRLDLAACGRGVGVVVDHPPPGGTVTVEYLVDPP